MGRVSEKVKSRRSPQALTEGELQMASSDGRPGFSARGGMASIFEGNQFMFLVLLALVISGALRVTLEFRGSSPMEDPSSVSITSGRSAEALPCRKDDESLSTPLFASPPPSFPETQHNSPLQHPSTNPSSPFYQLKPWTLPSGFTKGLFTRACTLDPAQFRFHIKVLAFDRVDSILRILHSLATADYEGDPVSLDIFLDHTFSGDSSKWDVQSAQRVTLSHSLLLRLDEFHWPHGPMRVVYRTQNHGIQPQWLEAWWPESCNDMALVVEDDMELSPLYYHYFKRLLAHYYYNASNFEPHMFGVSFQRQTFVAGISGSPMRAASAPFLYQLVGTWGQFLFPLQWRQFRLWYDTRRHNASRVPVLDGLKTTRWWFNKGNKLWTPWIIKWAYSESMFTLYPSLPGEYSLSISHRDKGSNFAKSRGADFTLVTSIPKRVTDPVHQWWRQGFPPLQQTVRKDLCNHVVAHFPPARQLADLKLLLGAMRLESKQVALTLVPESGFDLVRNWLCHLQGTFLRNFVLVVTSPVQASALSYMGHVVYHLGAHRASASADAPAGGAVWTAAHAELVLATLGMGYNVFVSTPENVWIGNPLSRDWDSSADMWGRLDPASFGDSALFVRSSAGAMAAWTRLHSAWVKAEEQGPGEQRQLLSRTAQEWISDASVAGKSASFRPIKGVAPSKANEGSGPDALPVVMVPSRLTKRKKVDTLKQAGLWVIDDFDFACKAVTCRKKMS